MRTFSGLRAFGMRVSGFRALGFLELIRPTGASELSGLRRGLQGLHKTFGPGCEARLGFRV